MKRKYYLRGLGTGILVTALILIIASGQKETMTDEEVKARAKELGMVESTLLSELANQTPEPDTPGTTPETMADPAATAEPETTEKATPEPAAEPETTEKATPEPAAEPETTAEPTPEPTVEPEATAEPATEPKTTAEPTTDPVTEQESVLVTIRSGESSVSVSKTLEEAGLVASAQAYDRYLCENGYDKKIRSGEHRIPVGADDAEIAAIITSGKR